MTMNELRDLALGLKAAAEVRCDQCRSCQGSEYVAFRTAALTLDSLASVLEEWVKRNDES